MTIAPNGGEPGEVFLAAMAARGGRCPFCDRPGGDTPDDHGRYGLAWCAIAWKAAGAEGRWLRAHPVPSRDADRG
jgi:hypothetical protein